MFVSIGGTTTAMNHQASHSPQHVRSKAAITTGHVQRTNRLQLAQLRLCRGSPNQHVNQLLSNGSPCRSPAWRQVTRVAAPAAAKADTAVREQPTADQKEKDLVVPAVPGEVPSDALIIFVLGGPGTGKGTQCDHIKARYKDVVHLSAGDLLRDEVESGSEVGTACNVLMTEGKLVPVSVTIQLLKNAMIKSGGNVFLIDGFPRALDQAHVFEKDIGLPKAVLFFDCPEEEMQKRLQKRSETSDRADDNAETISKRFKAFEEESLPVKDYYAAKGLAHVISAVPPPEEIYPKVEKALDPIAPLADAPAAK